MRIVLGISGGIAAYKSAILLRLLKEAGHDVVPVPTASALNFVGRATWEALSGHPVTSEVFEDVDEVRHVKLGREADLVAVAPATADLLSRAATGRADDLLTSTLLTATCPVVYAPAMHTEMWENAATRANVATLRERGAHVVEPAVGRLTGKDTGAGRLPEPEELFTLLKAYTHGPPADLSGYRIVVSAGGTRESIDPVRFIGNHSSGKQGAAIAAAAAAAGADVHLIGAHMSTPVPAGVSFERVNTTVELLEASARAFPDADAAVLAAAPADFRADFSERKIKRTGDTLDLELHPNPDIAAALGEAKRPGQVLVVFAAETDDGLANAQKKLAKKNADLAVYNDVSAGRVFGSDRNAVSLLDAGGVVAELAESDKDAVAHALIGHIAERLVPDGERD